MDRRRAPHRLGQTGPALVDSAAPPAASPLRGFASLRPKRLRPSAFLARYVFKSALGPGRLLGYDAQGRIRLQCHESGTNRPFVITLTTEEFLRRWCLHVLPKGFVRVRHQGWMSGAARKIRLRVRALVCGELDEPAPVVILPPAPRCERCGAEMKLVAKVEPRGPPPRT